MYRERIVCDPSLSPKPVRMVDIYTLVMHFMESLASSNKQVCDGDVLCGECQI